MKQAHALTLSAVQPQGTDAVLLRFAPDAGRTGTFRFAPGQYLTLRAGPPGAQHWRCYSITSAPDAPLEVLVRRVRGGVVSNWICDHARAGDTMMVFPPAGSFTLRSADTPILLLAGGSGIAPILSLARHALTAGHGPVAICYANRDRATAMLVPALDALQARFGARLRLEYWYDAEDGLPSVARLAAFAAGPPGRDAYVCGPEPFMHAAGEALAAAGFDAARIHREDFGAPPADDLQEDAPSSTLTVEFDGRTASVAVAGGQTLLAAMLDAGLDVPHACNAGECASCMCRLVAGEIERLGDSVLDDDDIADGWLVACRSRARGGELAIRFP